MTQNGVTYVEGSRNAYISRAGYLLNRYGVSEKDATDWAVAKFSDYDGDVPGIIRACHQQTDEHGEEAKSKVRNGKNARLAAYVHVTTDAAHFTHCLRKWLVGLVAGLFSEKVSNQVVLVLIGPQGCGKTTFFEYLLPPELYRYYCTKTNSNRLDKDDRLMLSEYALINFEELESMRTAEMNQLKAMITLRTVNDRRAYGRYVEQRPRIASFRGTGNALRFLNDPTGTRRWLPFEVTHIDDPRTSPFHYEGIYSQALHLLRTGFRHWFTQDEVAAQAVHNEAFEVPNPEEELIATYYRRPLPGEVCKFVTTTNIQERINAAIKQPLSLVRIAAAMKKMEFEQGRSKLSRGFYVVERSHEEVVNYQRETAHFLRDFEERTSES